MVIDKTRSAEMLRWDRGGGGKKHFFFVGNGEEIDGTEKDKSEEKESGRAGGKGVGGGLSMRGSWRASGGDGDGSERG